MCIRDRAKEVLVDVYDLLDFKKDAYELLCQIGNRSDKKTLKRLGILKDYAENWGNHYALPLSLIHILGVREGFVPVLIQADDETLLECLVMNADPEHDADCYEFDLKTVEEYRKKMLSAPVKDGKAILEELTGQRKEEAEDDDMDWEAEVLGEMEGGYDNDRFSCYWDSDSHMTYPLILAKIPVKNPWEIFAYLPFGNWNECPDTPDLMAVAKYWFEQHGAIPAAMSHDELEFELPTPISKERAMEVAVEQYGFCPDLDQNEDGSIGSLADVLWQSTVWYFWWD